jgi:hypothetical protein
MLDLVKLADDLYRWHGKDSEEELKELVLNTLTPLTTEAATGFLYKKVRFIKCKIIHYDRDDMCSSSG